MKLYDLLLFVFLILFFCSYSQKNKRIIVSADFERGNIGSLKEVGKNLFRGQTMHWIKKNQKGNQYYWFYFKMEELPNEEITIQLDNLTGVYRNQSQDIFTGYVQPVLSYDQKNWERISDVAYNEEIKRFTFRFTPEHKSSVLVHLANMSYRAGNKQLIFDPETETVVNDAEANAMVTRECRNGFEIPEAV